MIRRASRIANVGGSPSLAIAERARQLRQAGKPVIDLSLGELDFDTPRNVREAAVRAIEAGATRYDSVAGVRTLREAICAKLARENGLHYDPEQVSVGCGAKQIISTALLATLDPGDEVIVPIPCWTSYPEMVKLAGGSPVSVTCEAKDGFKLQPQALRAAISPRTRWVILNSPNNPTGAVYSASELASLARVLAEFPQVAIISDDIYEHIVFPPCEFRNIAAVDPNMYLRTLTVNGVSKTFAMTGWRVGYGAGPKELIYAINLVQSQTTTHTCTISQHAAVEALNGPQAAREEYSRILTDRAQIATDLIRQIEGLACVAPAGAFYCFADCSGWLGKRHAGGYLESDTDVAGYLLERALVACVPGSAYGLSPYIRFSFAADTVLFRAAVERIDGAARRLT